MAWKIEDVAFACALGGRPPVPGHPRHRRRGKCRRRPLARAYQDLAARALTDPDVEVLRLLTAGTGGGPGRKASSQ